MVKKLLLPVSGIILASLAGWYVIALLAGPRAVYLFEGGTPRITDELTSDWGRLEGLDLTCPEPTPFCRFVADTLGLVPEYRQFVEKGFRAAAGKRIDFLLIYHRTYEGLQGKTLEEVDQDKIHAQVMESNRLIEQNILALKPDVIGTEGCYHDRCDMQGEVEDAKRGARDLGIQVSPQALEDSFRFIQNEIWYLQFGPKYPDLPLHGVDNYRLQMFEQTLTIIGGSTGESYADLVHLIWRLRSQYALASMALKLKDGQSGVVVMGYAHGRDFKKLAPALGIKGGIYKAIPANVTMSEF